VAEGALTSTQLLAAASSLLLDGGYREVRGEAVRDWNLDFARAFEDPYNIVSVIVYETWSALSSDWLEAEGRLVELISRSFRRDEAKSWDGYLVLLTPSVLPSSSYAEFLAIRGNTRFARKLVATADDLRGIEDVRRVLLPVLSLQGPLVLDAQQDPLEILREVLDVRGIPKAATDAVIDAFLNQRAIFESIHAAITRTEHD
jgi:hypothetical protein